MQIGDWVMGNYYGGTKFIGYIDQVTNKDLYTVQLISPHRTRIKRKKKDILPLQTEIHPDDLPTLIDLALFTKDKEWFEQLTLKGYELSL